MKQTIVLLLLLIETASAWAVSSVWVVSNGAQRIFVAGSVHFLRRTDHPLPKEFDEAFGQSDKIFFETDLTGLQDGAVQQQFLAQGLLPPGESLRQLLRPATLKRLEQFCQKRNIPLEPLLRFKPWMLAINLTALELSTVGINPEDGVEPTLLRRSNESHKTTLGLVPVEEHFKTLLTLEKVPVNEILDHSFTEIDQVSTMAAEIIAAWRVGDTSTLSRVFVEPLEKAFPAIHRALLTDRNKRWIPTLEALLSQPKPSMVVVGVGHLVGEQNVLQLLQNKGYVIKRL